MKRIVQIVFTLMSLFTWMIAQGQKGTWINISDELCTQLDVMDKPYKANKQTAGVFVDPRNGDVYMTVCSKGIYKSTDFGESWNKWSPSGMIGRGEMGFAHNIHYPYTGRIAIFHIDGSCGYTTDNGATWNMFSTMQRNWDIGDINWNADQPQTMVTVLHEGNPFYSAQLSTDKGASYSTLDAANCKKNCYGVVNSTSIVRSAYGTSGINFSGDMGATWSKVSNYSPLGRTPVHYGNKLYWAASEGIIVSEDGQNWSLKGTALANATWGPYFGNTEDQMMVVTPDGFFITTDGCQSWTHALPWHTMSDGWGTGAYNDIAQYIHFGWDPVNNIIYQSVLAGSTQKYELDWSIDPNAGFVKIFDGETFDGWDIQYNKNKPGTEPPITIVDGSIRMENTSYPNQGWLRYNVGTYKNFILKLEGRYRTSGANSGIFFRAYSGTYGQWVNPGYEINHRHSSEPPMSGAANLELYGPEGKYPLLNATYGNITQAAIDEWADFYITVIDNSITIDYNGQKNCVVFDTLTLPAGYIGLQSETGVFEYRNIYLKSLDQEVIPPTISTASLSSACTIESYLFQLTANGGKPEFTWRITEGALPEGLTLSTSGAISGTPLSSGTYNFTVEVADQINQTDEKQLTLNVLDAGILTVHNGTASGTYCVGTTVEICANIPENKIFDGWTGDTLNLSDPAAMCTEITITSGSTTLTANFRDKLLGVFSLDIIASGNGLVNVNPLKTVYDEGDEVVLTPVPQDRYRFSGWSGDATGKNNPLTVTMNANKQITATFDTISDGYRYLIFEVTTVNKDVLNIPSIDWLDGDAVIFNQTIGWNSVPYVIVTDLGPDASANPTGIKIYTVWDAARTPKSFNCYGSNDVATENWVLLHSETDATDYPSKSYKVFDFETGSTPVTYVLTVLKNGNGAIVANPQKDKYLEGDSVMLTAVPDEGYMFTGWTGDEVRTDNPLKVHMTANKSITADFAEVIEKYTLSINITGLGTVTANGTPYAQPIEFDEGTTVSLEALASNNWEFSSWSGGVASTGASATITMDGDKTVEALFTVSTDVPMRKNNMSIYPNPCHNEITVVSSGNTSRILLTNILGVVLMEEDADSGRTTISLEGFNSGVYYVILEYEDGLKDVARVMKR